MSQSRKLNWIVCLCACISTTLACDLLICVSVAQGDESQELCRGSYLLAGKATLVEQSGFDRPFVPRETMILVARTPARALVGWSYDGQEAIGERHRFSYSGPGLTHAIAMDFVSESKSDLLSVTGLALDSPVRQGALQGTESLEVHALAVTGPFSNYPLAVFFCSPDKQFVLADTPAILNGENVVCNSFGEFIASDREGKQLLVVQQGEDDLASRSHKTMLGEIKSPLFKKGIKSVLLSAEFSKVLTDSIEAPWTVRKSKVITGIDGAITKISHDIFITQFTVNATKIDGEIDKILALIPNGQAVVTSDNMSYR